LFRLRLRTVVEYLVEFVPFFGDAHLHALLFGQSFFFSFFGSEPEPDSVLVSVIPMGLEMARPDMLVGKGAGAEYFAASPDGTGPLFLFEKLFREMPVIPISRPQVFLHLEKAIGNTPVDALSLYGSVGSIKGDVFLFFVIVVVTAEMVILVVFGERPHEGGVL